MGGAGPKWTRPVSPWVDTRTVYGPADALRDQRPPAAGEEEVLAEGPRRQGGDLGLLRLHARARPALAAARDHREDGQGARRAGRLSAGRTLGFRRRIPRAEPPAPPRRDLPRQRPR